MAEEKERDVWSEGGPTIRALAEERAREKLQKFFEEREKKEKKEEK